MSSQDLECDVSVEDDNRQEWIFTLYDFDNSGKVTKEVCVHVCVGSVCALSVCFSFSFSLPFACQLVSGKLSYVLSVTTGHVQSDAQHLRRGRCLG